MNNREELDLVLCDYLVYLLKIKLVYLFYVLKIVKTSVLSSAVLFLAHIWIALDISASRIDSGKCCYSFSNLCCTQCDTYPR